MLDNMLKMQKINTKLMRLLYVVSLLVLLNANGLAQTQLELSNGSYAAPPLGLTTANQSALLLENTTGSTFLTFNTNITVTASISNQQYNNISTSRISTGKAMNFGGRVNSILPIATQVPVYNSLNSVDIPNSNEFTSNPNGPASTGIDVADNYGFYFYNSVDELFTTNVATNGRYYFGDITLTFSQPVSNPVIHLVGLGSNVLFGINNAQGMSTELELETSNVVLSKLSGTNELEISANRILNNASIPTHDCGSGAACGSIKATGSNITSLKFKVYVRGDGNGIAWSHTAINAGDEFIMSVSINAPNSIAGNVFNDLNGLSDNRVNGIGTNVGGALFINLIDSITGLVVSSAAVANDGSYLLPNIGDGNYNLVLSTAQGVQGNAAPAASLPNGWINIGEHFGTSVGSDGNVNGILAVTVSGANITEANFGITPCSLSSATSISASGPTSVCYGAGLTLTSTTALSYQWYRDTTAISGATSQTYIPTISGSYSMHIVTGGGACNISSNAIPVNISYAITPTITPSDTAIICSKNNDKICPAVWGYSNYQWFKDSIAIPTPTGTSSCFYPTVEGKYTLAAQNGSGCWSLQSSSVFVIIDTICNSGGVTSGGGGGVESKSLGDVISKRLYGNAYNSIPEVNGYSNLPIFIKNSGAIVNGGATIKLNDLFPTKALNTIKAYVTTPTDIINFTNALEVLSVDYRDSFNTKAVAFGTKTLGEVYSHTKPICDRLKEGKLLSVGKINIEGFDLLTSTIKQRTGETEYCINFTVGQKIGRNSISIQSNWLTDNTIKEDTMYNFQLWAANYNAVMTMAKDVINKVKSIQPLQATVNNANDLPKIFVESVTREKTNIIVVVNNPTNYTTCSFTIKEKANENATVYSKLLSVSLKANSKNTISIPVSDSYEGNLYLYNSGVVNDLVYMSDGAWNIDYDQANTSIKQFNISNGNFSNDANEYPLFRKVSIQASTKNYLTAYKLVKGGGLERNFNDYKSIKFKAAATGISNIKITIVKKSITDWANQYSYTTTVTGSETDYVISLSKFVSKSSSTPIDLSDVTAINFSWENRNGGTVTLSTTIDKLRFSKDDLGYVTSMSDKEITIYPNPNQGKFKVGFMLDEDKPIVLKVTEFATGLTLQNQFINAKKGTNNATIDLSSMSIKSGLYIVTIEADGLLYNGKKVIISKP